jgi:hypothetical protein
MLFTPCAGAQAHFPWIVAVDGKPTEVEVLFSDSLKPDNPELLQRIAHTKFVGRPASGGNERPIDAGKPGSEHWRFKVPDQLSSIVGVCEYGVLQRGDSKPFLLNYYPKLHVAGTLSPTRVPPALEFGIELRKGDGIGLFLLFNGKPVPNAEVAIIDVATGKTSLAKTNKEGDLEQEFSPKRRHAFRALQTEAKAGEKDGMKYEEIRHYATLVIEPMPVKAVKPAADVAPKGTAADPATPSAEATKLLADARAARAVWTSFPGFRADVEINYGGKLLQAKVRVDGEGKVILEGVEDKEAASWARRVLSSIVGHRLVGVASGKPSPCAFGDDDVHHDLGRHVRVLNDELHSSYRIRDNQIVVVNRTTGPARFSIIVLDSTKSAEGKFLTTSYVVHYWDAKSGELQRSEGHEQSWTRVGGFDLPKHTRVVTTSKDVQSNSLRLKNHQLERGAAK